MQEQNGNKTKSRNLIIVEGKCNFAAQQPNAAGEAPSDRHNIMRVKTCG